MKKLMKKYGFNIKQMMLIASLDELTWSEMKDLEFVEDRIIAHLEAGTKRFKLLKNGN